MPPKVHPFVEDSNDSDFTVFQYSIENDMSSRTETAIVMAYFLV